MKAPLLVGKDLCFGHSGQAPLFSDLNISLDHGHLGLIGANGSGKTTLFHLLMGLLTPASGQVFLRGEAVVSRGQWQELRRLVGYLFQDADDQLFSPTVIEDVAFGLLNHGVGVTEAKARAMTTLSGLGLAGLAQRVTHQLSGGEKKLVSLATILVMEPLFLLLDEPTNNLDPATRHILVAILQGIDLPYLIISHDFDFLAATTEEIYRLDQGHLQRSATAQLHTHAHIHIHGDHPHAHNQP